MDLRNEEVIRVSNAIAAGTDDVTNCTGVDISESEKCTFIVALGAITATGTVTLSVEASDDNDSYGTLTGVTLALDADDDNKLAVIEVTGVQNKYVRLVITRATANAVIDGAIAILGRRSLKPITQGSTVAGTAMFTQPLYVPPTTTAAPTTTPAP